MSAHQRREFEQQDRLTYLCFPLGLSYNLNTNCHSEVTHLQPSLQVVESSKKNHRIWYKQIPFDNLMSLPRNLEKLKKLHSSKKLHDKLFERITGREIYIREKLSHSFRKAQQNRPTNKE